MNLRALQGKPYDIFATHKRQAGALSLNQGQYYKSLFYKKVDQSTCLIIKTSAICIEFVQGCPKIPPKRVSQGLTECPLGSNCCAPALYRSSCPWL